MMTETHEVKDLQAPHVKWPKYVGVAVVLAVITVIEIIAATYMRYNPDAAGIITPILIGFTLAKAVLVMLFYMHLKYDTRWYSVVLVFPLFMVVVLFVIVLIAAASWQII